MYNLILITKPYPNHYITATRTDVGLCNLNTTLKIVLTPRNKRLNHQQAYILEIKPLFFSPP